MNCNSTFLLVSLNILAISLNEGQTSGSSESPESIPSEEFDSLKYDKLYFNVMDIFSQSVESDADNLLSQIAARNTEQPEQEIGQEVQNADIEELYDLNFVKLLNEMATLTTPEVSFNDMDYQLLSEECNEDLNLLDSKKESIAKYRQKMQGIQCVNVLIVMNMLNELKKKISKRLCLVSCVVEESCYYSLVKRSLRKLLKKYSFYMAHMLSVLHVARVTPLPWQIEMFTLLSGFADSGSRINNYVDHCNNKTSELENNLNTFANQCVQYGYLKESDGNNKFGIHVGDVDAKADDLYKNPGSNYAYSVADRYTVPNLMLMHLYDRHAFVYDWSASGIDMNMAAVESRLTEIQAEYRRMYANREWQLNPMGDYRYHAVIQNCIRLRLLYHMCVHIHVYYTVQTEQPDDVGASQTVDKDRLLDSWSALVRPLKKAIRKFRFDDGLCHFLHCCWSPVLDMMKDINLITTDGTLAQWEGNIRDAFSYHVEQMKIMSGNELNRILSTLPVSGDYKVNLDLVESNADMLDQYIDRIIDVLKPVDGAFISLLIFSRENKTFHTR